MGDLYASAIGTTVLQLKAVPECPPRLRAAVWLGGLHTDVSKSTLLAGLRGFGDVASCELSPAGGVAVVFASQGAADDMLQADVGKLGWCQLVSPLYNTRPYHDRGWCCFEACVSMEVVLRVTNYPKLRDTLSVLPPKVLTIKSNGSIEPLQMPVGGASAQQVAAAIRRITSATFTGKGDKSRVVQLYKDYVLRIVEVLQDTFATVWHPSENAVATMPLPRNVERSTIVYTPSPLLLAQDQLVLLHGSLVGIVRTAEARVEDVLNSPASHPSRSLDMFSQSVLPWR
eukprot:1047561-Prymnesium_polylepis.1